MFEGVKSERRGKKHRAEGIADDSHRSFLAQKQGQKTGMIYKMSANGQQTGCLLAPLQS